MSALHRKVLGAGLPPKPTLNLSSGAGQQRTAPRKRDYTPVSWSQYFDTYKDVVTDQNNHFRVYMRGNEGPVVFFLHGGGFSGLSWAVLSSILPKKITCQCYSMDIRGHGDSQTLDDDDLSAPTLANDVKLVIEALWKDDEEPPIALVGHSMGGAIAVHTATLNCIKNLVALIVIDVVEGSAMDALSSMQAFLQGRPKFFNSLEHAIEYSVRSGQIRNVESARVSMTGQIRKVVNDNTKQNESKVVDDNNVNIPDYSHSVMQTEIAEENEDIEDNNHTNDTSNKKLCTDVNNQPQEKTNQNDNKSSDVVFKKPQVQEQQQKERFTWRIDLTKTEKYWSGWFKGLSGLFLNVPQPKLLLLAGVDRLDRELMVGQMQGKFQMQILAQCGHAVHEDQPEEVADAIATFLVRNRIAQQIDDFNRPYPSC